MILLWRIVWRDCLSGPALLRPRPSRLRKTTSGDLEYQQPLSDFCLGDRGSEPSRGALGNFVEREKMIRIPLVQFGTADRDKNRIIFWRRTLFARLIASFSI